MGGFYLVVELALGGSVFHGATPFVSIERKIKKSKLPEVINDVKFFLALMYYYL